MTKNALLLHGTGGSDTDYYWFADTKRYLEDNGYAVWWPLLPHTENPELYESRQFAEQNMPAIDEETIIIGHSSACPLILDLLQHSDATVKQVVLVGGFYESIGDNGASDRMLPESFGWPLLRTKAREFVMINSDNDPWGCTDALARPAAIALEAKLIVNTGQGHMGSTSFDQPYREFDLLKRLLDV